MSRRVDGSVKPIVIVTVDGGPDENPRFPKTVDSAVELFKKFNMDCMFVASEASGQSAYNLVERRMALLSRDLSRLTIEHDRYGLHLAGGQISLGRHSSVGVLTCLLLQIRLWM